MISVQPTRGRDGKWGEIIPEPKHNRYGRFKVYRRTVGDFVVFDPDDELEIISAAPTFGNEQAARDWAQAMANPARCRRCGDPLMPEEKVDGCSACEVAA